jgi:hypothetical protein
MKETEGWAMQAAENALRILPHLVDPNEEIPEIRASDMAVRIEAAFTDRLTWNAAVHESPLEGSAKLWLIVT